MMINELPKDFSSIATTFFEDYDNASRFAKDMEQNMKMLSGIDPLTTNQEVADYINDNNDQEILNGTEDALLQFSDRNAIELATQNMEALGVKKRVNPEISVYDYYTQNEIANKFTDDTYRVNFTNSKEDPSVYSTKYMIGSGKVYDALNSLKPNATRLAMRYIGQPATSLAMSAVGGWVGAGASDAVMSGWDAAILGGTIYNTQKRYIDRYHQLLGNSSLSLEQFTSELDNLLTEIQTDVAPEYQYEIFEGIIEGPNRFADAGLGFTTLGIRIYTNPFGFLAKTAKRMLPFGNVGNSIKRMEMNEKLVEQIQKSMSNKVDETAVDEAISAKVETVKPKDASEADVEMVKGIDKNKEIDKDLLQNSNNDSAMFDIAVSQEDIEVHNTASTVAKMNEEPTTILYEIIPESRRPKQNYYIDHGKGVNNDPMTLEEAMKEMNLRQTHKEQIPVFDKEGLKYWEENPLLLEEPDEIAFTSASAKPWVPDDEGVVRPYYSEITDRSGEGGSIEGKGVYATDVGGYEVSRNNYLIHSHQRRAENNVQTWNEDEILKKENFKDVENKVDSKKLFERIKRRFINELSNLNSLNEYNIKEMNIGFGEDYIKDLEKYLAKRNGEDLIYDLESKRESIYQAIQDFYYEGASLEDLKDYAKKIAVSETIQALFKGGNENPTSWLNTFTGPNPYKYPEKYIFNGMDYEPEVFGSFMGPRNDAHKNSINKFEDWKRDIKKKALNKGYHPVHGFGKMTGNERWEKDDWFRAVEVVSGLKGDEQKKWYRKELQKLGGYSATLHEHHDGTLNIVTINDKDFSEVTKIENNPEVVDNYLQIGKNNAHMIVSAGDGVGYFVRELHGIEGSKPMIVENYKVIDKGDWK